MPLPPDLSKSNKALDDYLSTLKETSEAEQRKQYRYTKMTRTRQQNAMKEAKVTEVAIEERGAAICKNTIGDSSIVVEKRVGYRVTCPHCGHTFVHFSKNLGKQYYCSCSRCHTNIRLKHYK